MELEEWLRRENGGAWRGGASTHARRIGKQNEPSYLSLVIPQKQHAARRIGNSWEQGFKYNPPSSSFLGGGDWVRIWELVQALLCNSMAVYLNHPGKKHANWMEAAKLN